MNMHAVCAFSPEGGVDEEFGTAIKILFDASSDKFLDVESLFSFVHGVAKNIEMLFSS
jgi:hypothetical protein